MHEESPPLLSTWQFVIPFDKPCFLLWKEHWTILLSPCQSSLCSLLEIPFQAAKAALADWQVQVKFSSPSMKMFVAILWALPVLLFLLVVVGLELHTVVLWSGLTIFPVLVSVLSLNISTIQCVDVPDWAASALQITLNFQDLPPEE